MKTLATLGTIALTLSTATASAQLIGSGPNLPIPSLNNPPPPNQPRATTITGGTWTGTWTNPAHPDWIGSFNATGPVPTSAGTVGTTRYDFTGLPNLELPSGTFFRFGDVDGGSTTNEIFTLRAFDAFNNVITTPWLSLPISVTGTGTGSGGTILPGNTPGWSWVASTGTYTIDGSTVTGGNPNVAVHMTSLIDISEMTLTRGSTFCGFSLAAPLIPSPATTALFGLGGLAACRRRR